MRTKITQACHDANMSVYCIPLAHHFYIVKLGFTGVNIFSYFCSKTKIVGTR